MPSDYGAVLANPGEATLVERGLPIRQLSMVIEADRRATDPIYGSHRWWARRPPALMRALLLGAALPATTSAEDFWRLFGSSLEPLSELRVHDPFMGGGSTLVEAARLGARVSGGDVDPLSVEIVRYELDPAPPDQIREAGAELLAALRSSLHHMYPATGHAQPLHYFWLHEVTCPMCGQLGLLYRNLILARDLGRPGAVVRDAGVVVFCPDDLSVHQLADPGRKELRYKGRRLKLDEGTFERGRYRCVECGGRSTHRELMTGSAPRRLIAVEETGAESRRSIRAPTFRDSKAVAEAMAWVDGHRESLHLPTTKVSPNRRDLRPASYGIEAHVDMFTDRQQAVFGLAFDWLERTKLSRRAKQGLRLAVSNALATNNKLCGYATDYGRISALFSVRGYSLPALAVELNPLHPSAGRGTLHNCIERVARAGAREVRRHVWDIAESRPGPKTLQLATNARTSDVVRSSAANTTRSRSDADLCVFDPPYFDYIAYDELSEFYRVWMSSVPVRDALLPSGDNPSERFGLELGACMGATLSRLAPGRPLAFTYHSANPEAWHALGVALDEAKLAVTGLSPVRSDGHMGHHSHPGNCEWDLVFACRRITETARTRLPFDLADWCRELEPLVVGDADRASMELAIATASSRFAEPTGRTEDAR